MKIRQNKSSLKRLTVFLAAVIFCGCGPTVSISPLISKNPVRSVAIPLPRAYTPLQREKLESMRESLVEEFSGKGYLVLANTVPLPAISFLQQISVLNGPDADHSGPASEILKRYQVDAVADLLVTSAFSTNIIAGYYASISGNLGLVNRSGEKVIEIKNTERERGGLLFNTGQVIEGLTSSYERTGEDSSAALLRRFVKSVTNDIPPAPKQTSAQAAIQIQSVSVEERPEGQSKVCLFGTPGQLASLVIGKESTPIREKTPGKYCSVIFLPEATKKALLRLSSLFGARVEAPLKTPSTSCLPQDIVHLRDNQIVITKENCATAKIVFYEAPAPRGPFKKIAQPTLLTAGKVYAASTRLPFGTLSVPYVFTRGER